MAHAIMKPHHLLSTSWKIRSQWYNPVWVQRPFKSKEVKGLRLSLKAKECGTDSVSPGLSQKVQEPVVPVFKGTGRLMSRVKQRVNSPFLCISVLFRLSVDWMAPTCIGEGNLLYSGYHFSCSSPQETRSQTWK